MESPTLHPRLLALPRHGVLGIEVAVARGPCSRLLGLAWIAPEQAGSGLLIPRCASVHTFGMRFPLDLLFLGEEGQPLAIHRGVPPCRFVSCRGGAAVLEVPVLNHASAFRRL